METDPFTSVCQESEIITPMASESATIYVRLFNTMMKSGHFGSNSINVTLGYRRSHLEDNDPKNPIRQITDDGA